MTKKLILDYILCYCSILCLSNMPKCLHPNPSLFTKFNIFNFPHILCCMYTFISLNNYSPMIKVLSMKFKYHKHIIKVLSVRINILSRIRETLSILTARVYLGKTKGILHSWIDNYLSINPCSISLDQRNVAQNYSYVVHWLTPLKLILDPDSSSVNKLFWDTIRF